jgi:predicted AlkP superfamily phosphohydrolase/phosphomutase
MNNGFTRRQFLRIAGAGVAAGSLGFPAIVSAKPLTKRMIVLGIDGMDPKLVRRFIQNGSMPNAAKLAGKGTFMPLRSSDPPQSPVAWSNFISGTNPGGHGLFDFLARDPSTLIPHFSSSKLESPEKSVTIGGWKIPLERGRVTNLRKGPVFWTELEKRGVDCTVFKVPANFPPTGKGAKAISGLGTPDVHGSYGIFSFYTDKRGEYSHDVFGGRVERVTAKRGRYRCALPGPANSLAAEGGHTEIPFEVSVDPSNAACVVSVQGQEFILSQSEWSEWIPVKFTMMPGLVKVAGICRFFLKRARDSFELYVSPVNIDPMDPFLPISNPAGYSRDIAKRAGRFYTQGMPEDTSALSAGIFDDDSYRQQATLCHNERLKLFGHEFNRFRDGFFFFYFSTLDLNSHAFWRTLDERSPAYSAETTKRHGDFLPWLYRELDGVIGQAMNACDERTQLIVMSDHGFGPFRRQFNLNSWLMDNGYTGSVRNPSRGEAGFYEDADWSETKAYGLGLNGLYVNQKGREPEGIVAAGDDREKLLDELIDRLTTVRDDKTGKRVVRFAKRAADVYSGPYVKDAPDLLISYNRNYRASWETVLGKYPKEHILDNLDPWSGDHSNDASFVPGVLLSNSKVASTSARLEDLAPSILNRFGVPVPKEMTGKNVFKIE